MWPRNIELMLGLWLAASPFIYGHDSAEQAYWYADFAVATIVVACSLLSYWEPARYAHLGAALAGLGLIGFGFLVPAPAPAAAQNEIIVGLLLAMMAIIPNEASEPPRQWREMERAQWTIDLDNL